MLWTVYTLARAVTKLNPTWDKRLAKLISCIRLTAGYTQNLDVVDQASACELGSFQDASFAGDFCRIQNPLLIES